MKKLTRNMEKILNRTRVFITISKSELKLEQMEARISIKSCRNLTSGTDEAHRGPHTVPSVAPAFLLTCHATCRKISTKTGRFTFREGFKRVQLHDGDTDF